MQIIQQTVALDVIESALLKDLKAASKTLKYTEH